MNKLGNSNLKTPVAKALALSIGGIVMVLGSQATPLYAQQARTIEEVVVTAQRREQTLQDVPIAVDVVTGDQIVREGVYDVRDLGKMSTELEMADAGNRTSVSLRGMQQGPGAQTQEMKAAVHLNDATLSSFYSLNGVMFDIERVEVLPGPQGTLFGRNAAAGAINLITRRPGEELEANIMADFGSEALKSINGGVSVPVTDEFSVRLAGRTLQRDPIYSSGHAEEDQWSARLSGLWRPTPVDQLFFTYDASERQGTTSNINVLVDINRDARMPDGSVPASVTNFLDSPSLSDPYNNQPYLNQRNLDFFGHQDQENWGVYLEYIHNFDGFDTIFQYSHRYLDGIAGGGTKAAGTVADFNLIVQQEYDSAELRIASSDATSLEWVAGLFYYDSVSAGWNAGASQDNSPDPITGHDVPYCPCYFGFYPNYGDAYSYAGFGQAVWTPEAMDRLHITAGARYTYDWKDAHLGYWVANTPIFAFGVPGMDPAVQELFEGFPDLAAGDNERTWSDIQWRLGAQYDLTDSSMVYGSVATGYKGGALTYGPTPETKPENVLALEVGYKSQHFDNTLRFNTAAWWYDYTDFETGASRNLPFTATLPNGGVVTTAGSTASVAEADLGGATAEVVWFATPNDQLDFSFTYVYSKIVDGKETSPAGFATQRFHEGERLGDFPKWNTLTRYTRYFNLPNGGVIDGQARYQWVSEKWDQSGIDSSGPNLRSWIYEKVPSQGILDLSVGYTSPSERWNVMAYVNNATDELDIESLSYTDNPGSSTYGHITANLRLPRTYGLQVSVDF